MNSFNFKLALLAVRSRDSYGGPFADGTVCYGWDQTQKSGCSVLCHTVTMTVTSENIAGIIMNDDGSEGPQTYWWCHFC